MDGERLTAPEASVDLHQTIAALVRIIAIFDHRRALPVECAEQRFRPFHLGCMKRERYGATPGRNPAFRRPFLDAFVLKSQRRLAAGHMQHLAETNAGAIALHQWIDPGGFIAPQHRLQIRRRLAIFGLQEGDPMACQPIRHPGRVRPFQDDGEGGWTIVRAGRLQTVGHGDADVMRSRQRRSLVEHVLQRPCCRSQNLASRHGFVQFGQRDQIMFGNRKDRRRTSLCNPHREPV